MKFGFFAFLVFRFIYCVCVAVYFHNDKNCQDKKHICIFGMVNWILTMQTVNEEIWKGKNENKKNEQNKRVINCYCARQTRKTTCTTNVNMVHIILHNSKHTQKNSRRKIRDGNRMRSTCTSWECKYWKEKYGYKLSDVFMDHIPEMAFYSVRERKSEQINEKCLKRG